MPNAAPIAQLPGDSRPGARPWLEWIVLAIAIVIGFGAVVPDYFQGADDLLATGVMHEVALEHPRVVDRLGAVVFSDEGEGHFRPTQDFVYVLLYAAFGPEKWIFACMVLYALCHFASGCLLIAILRRLGCNRAVSFVAALIFVLHPVWDENLASVQFGNNVPGLATILAAALLWLPSKRRETLRLAGASVFLYLAIGLGLNLMVAGAILLGLMTLVVARQRRSFATLFVRGAFLGLTLGLGALHRLLAYGALSTKHPSYQNMGSGYELTMLLSEVPRSAFLLMASPMAWWTTLRNPPGLTWDDGKLPLLSWDGAIVLATTVAICFFVFFLRRRDAQAPPAPGSQRLSPAFWFGLALTFAMLFPYYAFVGRAGPHRYLYPSVAGLAVMATTAGAAACRRIATFVPERVAALAGAAVLGFVLAALIRVDREAARSIASGHRVAREVSHGVAAELRKTPGVDRIFVLGYPRMIGRAGHSIVFPAHLLGILNAMLGTKFGLIDAEFQTVVNSGELKLPLPPNVKVYLVEPDGVTVRALSDSPDKELPTYARGEGYAAQARSWRLEDDWEALAALLARDPTVVEVAVRVLADVERFERRHLIRKALLDPRAPLLLTQPAFALAATEPDGKQFVSQVAVITASQEIEQKALEFLAQGNAAFNEAGARRAVKLEREAHDVARRGGNSADNLKAFQTAQAAWKEVGVTRDDLYDSISFSRLLDLDDAGLIATQQDWASRGWSRLASAAAALRATRSGAPLDGFSIDLIPRGERTSSSGAPIALEVMVHNRSDRYVPGAVSALSARLVWTAVSADGSTTPAGDQWFPPEGIDAKGDKNVMASVAPVNVANLATLRVDLIAYGKKCATASWNVAKTLASAATTEKK